LITSKKIRDLVFELIYTAQTELPKDIEDAIRYALDRERNELARIQLKNIIHNIELARKERLPICQDTGVPTFFISGRIPCKNFERTILDAVKIATEKIPLRPNVVEPLERTNTGNNLGKRIPYIYYKYSDNEFKKDYTEITFMPKGAGCENMAILGMLPPVHGLEGLKEFVLDAVLKAGGKACPPMVLGLGIGGSAEIAVQLSKEALLRPINVRNEDEKYARIEKMLLESLNLLDLGPMGLGGDTTVLGVNIEYAHCHTATFPVSVSFQCWATRRAKARIYKDGYVEFIKVH